MKRTRNTTGQPALCGICVPISISCICCTCAWTRCQGRTMQSLEGQQGCSAVHKGARGTVSPPLVCGRVRRGELPCPCAPGAPEARISRAPAAMPSSRVRVALPIPEGPVTALHRGQHLGRQAPPNHACGGGHPEVAYPQSHSTVAP